MKDQSHQTMRAVAIDEFGGIDKMKSRKLPVPQVAADEILVRVDTAGVGVWDPFEREGGFAKEYGMQANFPHVLGGMARPAPAGTAATTVTVGVFPETLAGPARGGSGTIGR